jgi:uncharacterized protein (DUF1800 family)
MAISNRLKNQHLLWRAGFGPSLESTVNLDTISQKKLWELLLKNSSVATVKIEVAQNFFEKFYNQSIDTTLQPVVANKGKIIREQSREDLKKLNVLWIQQMTNSDAQLQEKMSLFWHGHFACRVINSYFQQELLTIIRENALGNFKDLLRAVSKSASMLNFLNNQQNKKKKPNENFAREVMELFTIGRGNYTETDVKEAARAFTGWAYNEKAQFEFKKNVHDEESKTVLGKTGQWNGDDVLDILLAQKQTALFICKKVYKYFVNEKVDEAKVEWLSNRFYNNNYDIKKLVEDIFTSNWFYEEKNIGIKVKSPVELLVGIKRLLPMQMQNEEAVILFQRTLGQVLFYPPNVAGWPGGKNWIDSTTLMLRLRIPQILTANEMINIKAKDDDDVMMGQMKEEKAKKMNQIVKGATAQVQWKKIFNIYEKIARENLLQKITDINLQTKNKINNTVLLKYINTQDRTQYITTATIYLMSTPEYQLC